MLLLVLSSLQQLSFFLRYNWIAKRVSVLVVIAPQNEKRVESSGGSKDDYQQPSQKRSNAAAAAAAAAASDRRMSDRCREMARGERSARRRSSSFSSHAFLRLARLSREYRLNANEFMATRARFVCGKLGVELWLFADCTWGRGCSYWCYYHCNIHCWCNSFAADRSSGAESRTEMARKEAATGQRAHVPTSHMRFPARLYLA